MTTNTYIEARMSRTRANNEALAIQLVESALGSPHRKLDDSTARVICASSFRRPSGSLQHFAATGALVDSEDALAELEGSATAVPSLNWITALWDYLERKNASTIEAVPVGSGVLSGATR